MCEDKLVKLITEQPNPATTDLDLRSTLGILEAMSAEDAKSVAAVRAQLPQIAQAVDLVVESLRAGGRLFYVGAGTSGRLGVLDASECPPTFGVSPDLVQGIIAGGDTALRRSSEGMEDHPRLGAQDIRAAGVRPGDVVVGISASGRAPYVRGALQAARRLGAVTIAIANHTPADISVYADLSILPITGPEVLAGSTRLKAGTTQKMILNMLTTAAFTCLGRVYGNLMVDLRPTNAKLRARALRIIRQVTGVDQETAAHLLRQADNRVKVALVMHLAQVDAAEANARLERGAGFVRAAVALCFGLKGNLPADDGLPHVQRGVQNYQIGGAPHGDAPQVSAA